MMTFTALSEMFVPVVLVACLCLGYILKKTFDFVPNKYIPTILALVGAGLTVLVNGVSVESVVYGALTGLASTGLHQAFTKFIEKPNDEEIE